MLNLKSLLTLLLPAREETSDPSDAQRVIRGEELATLDPFPGPVFGPEPVLTSEAEVRRACEQIGWLHAYAQRVGADHDQLLAILQKVRARELRIQFEDGDETDVLLYRSVLDGAVVDYARNHSAEVFPKGKKSARFPGCEIKAKTGQPKLAPTDAADFEKRLDAATVRLHALAAADPELQSIAPLVRIRVELDVSGLLDQVKSKKLTAELLAAQGLTLTPATDNFTAKPAKLD